jgi:hypothetical protein
MVVFNELLNNFREVQIGGIQVWFSFETPIAFKKNGIFYCSENVWTRTTAKHLNIICSNKSERIPNKRFMELLTQATWYEDEDINYIG